MNYQGGLVKAKKQFLKDLSVDKDFIAYKERCKETDRVIIVGQNKLLLEKNNIYVKNITYIR